MNDGPPKSLWGPWSPDLIDHAERKAQLRCIRTLVHVMIGSRTAPDYTDTVKTLEQMLQMAEFFDSASDQPESPATFALDYARILFDALPAARQRDIIATYAVLHKPLVLKDERGRSYHPDEVAKLD